VLQAGLAAELEAHLDGEDGNRRNGSSVKTLNTEVGPVRIAVPRDRDGSFSPVLVRKQATRSDGLNAVITSLYAKLTIGGHFPTIALTSPRLGPTSPRLGPTSQRLR
jgi:putative transposase